MCGIAGFVNFENGAELVSMAQKEQSHRGPDSCNGWTGDNIALAHLRLSIIDLDARSDQPFIKNGLIMIFNGEIYNYQELRARIEQIDPSITFRTSSDTEVLLEWY